MGQRKSWSPEQDHFIIQKVRLNQNLSQKQRKKWGDIADQLNIKFPESKRTGKQCRQRWHNQLDPSISKQQWTTQQQKKLFDLQKKLGNKWAQIAEQLSGRTDNNVKNYFYSTLRKSLRKVNTFISCNKQILKNGKQFQQSLLSKLLAVADHKFDKKVNIKKDNIEQEAIGIKNMLIQITHLQDQDEKSKRFNISLVEKLQDFNKNCKKKKGKKKEVISRIEEQEEEFDEIQEAVEDQEEDNDQQLKLQQIPSERRSNRNRSRSRNNHQINKKQSNISRQQKKQFRKEKFVKPTFTKKSSSSLLRKRSSSKQFQNYQMRESYNDLNRSSLDFCKLDKKRSSSSYSDSQLFKSFTMNNNQPVQFEQVEGQKSQNPKRIIKKGSLNFFQSIRKVQLKRNDSRLSQMSDLLWKEEEPEHLRFFKQQSSYRQFPPLNYQLSKLNSSMNLNTFLDNNTRFQPQLNKLRSFSKKQSQAPQYEFGNDT